MDRVLSADERIRRAEEIYYRRKMMGEKTSDVARVNVGDNKRKIGLLKKTILQILICVVIYLIIHLVQTSNFVFSKDIINKTQEILSYDINFQNMNNNIRGILNGIWNNEQKKENENNEEVNMDNKESNIEEETLETETKQEVLDELDEIENLSQEEKDIKYILENVPMIKPLLGTITSRFGNRESDNPKVSKFHTGIDIAVDEGTVFVSSMDGTVKEVSSEGLFRSSCYS